MTLGQLVALINALVDDTLPGMAAEYYQKHLEISGDLSKLAQEESSPH